MQTSCRLIPSAKAAPQLRQYLYVCASKASKLSTCQIQKLAGARLAICLYAAIRTKAVDTVEFVSKKNKRRGKRKKKEGAYFSV